MEYKKISNLVHGLEEMFEKLIETFEICPEVRQVLFLLGGTTVSPKETYLINMPPYHPESNNLSSKFCVRYLIKELISQDLVGKLKDLKTTNATIMIRAPIDSGISWFLPKPNFDIPSRGARFHLNLISNPNSDCFNHDLTHEEHEMDISGIEPFEMSALDSSVISMEEQMMKLFISNDCDSAKLDKNHEHKKLPVIACIERSRRLSSMRKSLPSISENGGDKDSENEALVQDDSSHLKTRNHTLGFFSEEDTALENTTCNVKLSCDRQLSCDINKSLDTDSKLPHDCRVQCIWFQAPILIKGYKEKSITKQGAMF